MYRTKKEKKLQTQEKIIRMLEEENDCLKEQLELCNPEHVREILQAAQRSRKEYAALMAELTALRNEYSALLEDMKKDRTQLIRNCR